MTIDARWGTPSAMYDPYVLARFVARPTDVIVNTAPKSGTTWMQQLLHQLASGGDTSFESIQDVVPWLEFPGRTSTEERLAAYAAKPDPRLFKAHLAREATPGVDVARFVVVVRDPRACLVSHFHHLHGMTDAMQAALGFTPPPFDAFFEAWLERSEWFGHVASWWPHRDDSNVLWLRYADLRADLPAVVTRLVSFLGWSVDDDTIERALEHASFAWMAAHHDKFARLYSGEPPSFRPGSFVRAGRGGGRREELDAERDARVVAKAREALPRACWADVGID